MKRGVSLPYRQTMVGSDGANPAPADTTAPHRFGCGFAAAGDAHANAATTTTATPIRLIPVNGTAFPT